MNPCPGRAPHCRPPLRRRRETVGLSGAAYKIREVSGFNFFEGLLADVPRTPVKASSRAFRAAIEQAFIDSYARRDLEDVLAEELKLW